MDAETVAHALEGRWEGHQWRCRCPVHGGRSLLVRDADRDNPLVVCMGGCEFRDVVCALEGMGLWSKSEHPRNLTQEQRKRRKLQRKRAEAQRIVDKFESMPLSVRQDIEPEVFDAEWLRYERARALLAMEEA